MLMMVMKTLSPSLGEFIRETLQEHPTVSHTPNDGGRNVDHQSKSEAQTMAVSSADHMNMLSRGHSRDRPVTASQETMARSRGQSREGPLLDGQLRASLNRGHSKDSTALCKQVSGALSKQASAALSRGNSHEMSRKDSMRRGGSREFSVPAPDKAHTQETAQQPWIPNGAQAPPHAEGANQAQPQAGQPSRRQPEVLPLLTQVSDVDPVYPPPAAQLHSPRRVRQHQNPPESAPWPEAYTGRPAHPSPWAEHMDWNGLSPQRGTVGRTTQVEGPGFYQDRPQNGRQVITLPVCMNIQTCLYWKEVGELRRNCHESVSNMMRLGKQLCCSSRFPALICLSKHNSFGAAMELPSAN